MMKRFKVLLILCGMAALIAGCAVPMGDNYSINLDANLFVTYVTDYNLQTYVPIPRIGEAPVTLVNYRGDLDITVVWKDVAGVTLPSLPVFLADTVYRAEIKLTPRHGYGFNPSIPFEYHPGKITAQYDDLADPTRTVTVTYNNSNEADITYITDYNLQSYVPVPIAGERPVRAINSRVDLTVNAVWQVEDPPNSGLFVPIDTADSYVFSLGAVYRAEIGLTTKPGYRFREDQNFAYTDGSQTTPLGSVSDAGSRSFGVRYLATRAAAKISDYNLTTYAAKPVGGATAVMSLAGSQYTGVVSWRESESQAVLTGPFQYGKAYTAELVLSAASGYTIDGIGQNVFVHTGAESVTNPAGSGTVTIRFPVTASTPSLTTVYDTILTNRILKPVNKATPVTSFSASQYTGTVKWKNTLTNVDLIGSFQIGVSYTAVVNLSPAPGYTFTGIDPNVFSHTGAESVINPANSGTVTINFQPTGSSTLAVMSFGPVDAEGSALKLMKERKDDNNPVVIGLPGDTTEPVIPNTVMLRADYNSPANITIDGGGRVLKIYDPGILIMVDTGITLTLLNITLEGMDANNTPLIRVRNGGKLILGTGAVITGNQTTAYAGGVWVDGGELIMNSGAVIKKMIVNPLDDNNYGEGKGGGVLVGMNGKFTMNGGTIGGELESDGNFLGENCSYPGAGGVSINLGSFNMYGGTIQSNKTAYCGTAGGVAVDGVFNMYGGAIRGNISGDEGYGGGAGGVFGGTFTMNGMNAVIEDNIGRNGSGGVAGGPFTMIAGTIRNNTAHGGTAAGGVDNSRGFIMLGGTIENNTVYEGSSSAGGVHTTANFIMSGGAIKGNKVVSFDSYVSSFCAGAVMVRGQTFRMEGGTIGGENSGDANTTVFGANGVYLASNCHFIISEGTIIGNVGGDSSNYGVYVSCSKSISYPPQISAAKFTMSGSARVAQNNKVFLDYATDSYYSYSPTVFPVITIGGPLSASPAAYIIHESPADGVYLLKADSQELLTEQYNKFRYGNGTSAISGDIVQDGVAWYLRYQN